MAEESLLQTKIKAVEDALKKALDEQGLTLTTQIDFPKYRQLPVSLQLALQIMQDEGGVFVRMYEEKHSEPPGKK